MFFFLLLLVLTFDTVESLPQTDNRENLTAQVAKGKHVWENNNCIGCVKGGMAYWNKIRVDFPDVFEARARMEREVGRSCVKEVFLDELDPSRGRGDAPIVDDCGILCELEAIR